LVKKIILLYSPFQTSKSSQLETNVTWHDAYCQQQHEISQMNFTFNYQMPNSNIKKMNDSIYSKSKPLHLVNIWNDDINNEVNNSYPTIFIRNKINIEHNDLQSDFVIQSCSVSTKNHKLWKNLNIVIC
jgi:hypothetical protein